MIQVRYYPNICLKEITTILGHDTLCPGQDLNWERTNDKSEMSCWSQLAHFHYQKIINATNTNLIWRQVNRHPCLTHSIVYCILSIHIYSIHICNNANKTHNVFGIICYMVTRYLLTHWQFG